MRDAQLASSLVARGLAFYIADAEAEYAYSGPNGPSDERFRRSARFVAEFRRLRPTLLRASS